MPQVIRPVQVLVLTAVVVAAAGPAGAQPMLTELMTRHGITLPGKSFEAAFDAGLTPAVPVTPGAFAVPLAMLTAGNGDDQISAAYAFGILAGRSGKAAAPTELASAGQALVQMIASKNRRTRIAGARVAGRVFALPFEAPMRQAGVAKSGSLPAGLVDGLFLMLNQKNDVEQLAAMDAFGLIRERDAVSALTERYSFHRKGGDRSLAGGALEAMARIGDPSSVDLVKQVVADGWGEGRDATALAVAFARERLLRDGSIAVLRQALDDKARRAQARSYLIELGMLAVP